MKDKAYYAPLPYITRGLLWDLKTKEEILIYTLLKQNKKGEEDSNYHNWEEKNIKENIYLIVNKQKKMYQK